MAFQRGGPSQEELKKRLGGRRPKAKPKGKPQRPKEARALALRKQGFTAVQIHSHIVGGKALPSRPPTPPGKPGRRVGPGAGPGRRVGPSRKRAPRATGRTSRRRR